MTRRIIGFVVAVGLLYGTLRGDTIPEDVPLIFASAQGRYYARSIPEARWGGRGTTSVTKVEREKDVHQYTFPWYAPELVLYEVGDKLCVVRIRSWSPGQQAGQSQFALEFYVDGQLVQSYSTLDIAGKPENVSRSVARYTVFDEQLGVDRHKSQYQIRTVDERLIRFDLLTGKIVWTWTPERK